MNGIYVYFVNKHLSSWRYWDFKSVWNDLSITKETMSTLSKYEEPQSNHYLFIVQGRLGIFNPTNNKSAMMALCCSTDWFLFKT